MYTLKKYEIPFNFDIEYLNFLEKYIDKDWVEFIFLPAFKEDSSNARSHLEGVSKSWGTYKVPDTREEYEFYIKSIQKSGFKPGVLFQEENPIKDEILNYYLSLGIDTFVVNSDKLAKRIKSIDKNYKVIASITKTLSAKDLWEKDLSMYDKIVLHFPFNRALNKIKELPPFYKYSILVNSFCVYNCESAHEHWNSTPETSSKIHCMKSEHKENLIYIPPEYLNLFEPYIDSFKIQGREYPTNILTEEIFCFYKGLHSPFAGAIYNRLSPFNALEYFNKGENMDFVNYNNPNSPFTDPQTPIPTPA